jgi:putative ABC transport system permease protein
VSRAEGAEWDFDAACRQESEGARVNILECVRIALRSLQVNRMRSGLTMLGIIIGVAAVIAMVAIGSGATARIEAQIQSIGSNIIIVLPGSLTSGGMRLGSGSNVSLTEDDARAIASECPAVSASAPVIRGGGQVVYGSSNWATSIQGTTSDYLTVRDAVLSAGRPFTAQDVDAAAKVAILGQTVAENLFGDGSPLDQVIRIKNVPFTVVGVLARKGQSPFGQDQDDVILVPISTARRSLVGANRANASSVSNIMVQAAAPSLMEEAQQQMEVLLRQRHRLELNQEDDFTIRNLSEVFDAQESSARVMSLLLGAIASVSLVVGGIGIMNIMLVSVTERTREIGLRLAIGAKKQDILLQFLVEAVTLSALGGIVGILVGVGASAVISRLADWSTLISPVSILLAFLFSAFVGVSFGYYPARKAAWLDPIESLRYE